LPALLPPRFKAPGLKPLLDTSDFDAWSAAVGANLGDHRSDLLSSAKTFRSRMAVAQSESLQLLHLEGHGAVQLNRVQGEETAVLWLPLQGYSEEQINGMTVLAEPGMALLLRPGDVLKGRTSRHLEGLSILVPSERLAKALPRLLDVGPHNRALIAAAHRFADAIASGAEQGLVGAHGLLDQLERWQLAVLGMHGGQRERITAVRRRTYVAEASAWIVRNLARSFDVSQVAAAINVSVRTLQYACLEETGQSPMAMAKRLRLRQLRSLLQDSDRLEQPISELMEAAGLLACGATAADYRSYCGETPRQTRQSLQSPGRRPVTGSN